MRTIIPRSYYALCLGTFPIEQARELKEMLKKAPGCNVEFRLRGRGNRPKDVDGKKYKRSPYEDDLPLKMASHVSIYVSVKRSLKKMEKAGIARGILLDRVRRFEKPKPKRSVSRYAIDPNALGRNIAQSIIDTHKKCQY